MELYFLNTFFGDLIGGVGVGWDYFGGAFTLYKKVKTEGKICERVSRVKDSW